MLKSSPEPLDFNKSYLVKLTLLITLSNFVMGILNLGYEIGTCNTTEKHISKYISWPGYEYIYIAISSTLMCLGAAIGSLLTGKLANYYGRRKIIIINNTFMLIFVFIVMNI